MERLLFIEVVLLFFASIMGLMGVLGRQGRLGRMYAVWERNGAAPGGTNIPKFMNRVWFGFAAFFAAMAFLLLALS